MESENVTVGRRVPWNKGKLHRAEAADKAPKKCWQSEGDFRWCQTSGNS